MKKIYYIVAENGTEIIDSSQNAESRMEALNDFEERYYRKVRAEKQKEQKITNILYRLILILLAGKFNQGRKLK